MKIFAKTNGFTFAEALIMIMIVGIAFLPIVSSLQNNCEVSTRHFHKAALADLARSRLNREISAGAFTSEPINDQTMFRHSFLTVSNEENTMDSDLPPDDFLSLNNATVSSILKSFKTEIEIHDKAEIVADSLAPGDVFAGSLNGLKAVVVRAGLLSETGDSVIESESLFSLVNIPTFFRKFIWVANADKLEIYSVDPLTRTKIDTLKIPLPDPAKPINDHAQDPARPIHLVIHPNEKVLFCQGRNTLLAFNIDQDSVNYASSAAIYSDPDKFTDAIKNEERDKGKEDQGIVIRPDGKYLFVTQHKTKKVLIFSINWTAAQWYPSLSLIKSLSLPGGYDTDKFSSFHAGNDGWCYLGLKDKKALFRFSMCNFSYTQVIEDHCLDGPPPVSSKEADVLCSQTSMDGRNLYVLWKDNYLSRFDSETLQVTGRIKFSIPGAGKVEYFALAMNEKAIAATCNLDDASDSGIYFTTISEADFTPVPTTKTLACAFTGKTRTYYCALSPLMNEIVADPKELPEIYFVDFKSGIDGVFSKASGGIPTDRKAQVALTDKSFISFTSHVPDYILVGTSNGSRHTLEFVESSGFHDDLKSISLSHEPVTIGVSPYGHRCKVGFGEYAPSVLTYDFATGKEIILEPGDGGTTKIAYSSSIGVAGHEEDFAATLEVDDSNSSYNGIFSRYPWLDDNLDGKWVGQDLIGLNNGDFLVLYKYNDPGNPALHEQCMLDWYGKFRWGPNKGNYGKLASWHSLADGFPSKNAFKMAIGPNDRLLAIATTDSKILIYDFQANNFGHETQLKGLLCDYRTGGPGGGIPHEETDTPPPSDMGNLGLAKATFIHPLPGPGLALKECVSSNFRPGIASYSYFRDYAASCWFKGSSFDDLSKESNLFSKSIVRMFGYYRPKTKKDTISIVADNSSTRFFFENYPEKPEWPNLGGVITSSDFYTRLSSYNCPAFSSTFLQVENSLYSIYPNPRFSLLTSNSNETFGLGRPINSDFDYWSSSCGMDIGIEKCNTNTNLKAIPANEAMPFKFAPQLLAEKDFSDGKLAMVFSRDCAAPIFLLLQDLPSGNDRIWVWQEGVNEDYFEIAASDYLNQLIVTPDSQKLVYADQSNRKLIFRDVSLPGAWSFVGHAEPASGFGATAAITQLLQAPKCLGTKNYNRFRSKPPDIQLFSSIPGAAVPNSVSGRNSICLAKGTNTHGGIFYLTGNNSTSGQDLVFFAPPFSNSNFILHGKSKKAVRNGSLFSYDGQIFTLGGVDSAGNMSTTVQKLDPTSKTCLADFGDFTDPGMKPISFSVTETNGSNGNLWDNDEATFSSPAAAYELKLTFNMTMNFQKFALLNQATGYGINNCKLRWETNLLPPHVEDALTCADSPIRQEVDLGAPRKYHELLKFYDFTFFASGSNVKEVEFIGSTMRNLCLDDTSLGSSGHLYTGSADGCMTPYGYLWGGGYLNCGAGCGESPATATDSCFIYWPHALNMDTDNAFTGFGINREIPCIPGGIGTTGHKFLWFKGSVFLISSGPPLVFDFAANNWVGLAAAGFAAVSAADEPLLYRTNCAACTFKDEIYLFGGYGGAEEIVAWNPETGVIRNLGAMPSSAQNSASAIAMGSYIYLFGGLDNSSPPNPTNEIYRFIP